MTSDRHKVAVYTRCNYAGYHQITSGYYFVHYFDNLDEFQAVQTRIMHVASNQAVHNLAPILTTTCVLPGHPLDIGVDLEPYSQSLDYVDNLTDFIARLQAEPSL